MSAWTANRVRERRGAYLEIRLPHVEEEVLDTVFVSVLVEQDHFDV